MSTFDRPVAITIDRPVRTPPGVFAPLPDRAGAGIVLAVHTLEQGGHESPTAAACRSYLSQGLVAPGGILGPLGWLVDVTA